ncbi:HlyD family secretion protein [Chryseobacterium vrystaatense]|uniref:Membrane fusion protein, multidrug efflux system n=1 Tax=Chryseobacterium vrystaatense TaxID=307480 RepID=A0A1M5ER01_9FLAO|nr:HlyD family secretion protein [Chryseobacterium vrystaatense]SHF81708.1 membrane fusion protein, multidrug efflux system [Chryseobacterium vrystaatense]
MNKNNTDQIIVAITKWIGIIILIVVIIWGILYFQKADQYEQTNDAQVDAYLSPINAKVGGYISKIYFKDNQKVNAGDTLVVIEQDEYQLKKNTATSELMSSRAKLDILAANEESQRRNIDIIQARISGSRAKVQQQEQEYERYNNLYKEESTTKQKLENVYTTMLINKSAFNETQASLKAAESKLNDLRAERNAILAEIKTKETLLERQNLDIRYTVIRAPFTGQLGKKTIQEGQLIQPGQTLAFLTNESAEKWIIANFKETQIGKFKVGQKAKIELDAFPSESFSGEIESLSPTTGSRYSLLPPDNATGNFVKVIQRIPVRIKLTETKARIAKLSAGMNANVYITK